MPVLFDIGNLVKGDVQTLAHSVGVLAVLLGVAHPSLVQRVPVLHEDTSDIVACAGIRGSTVLIQLAANTLNKTYLWDCIVVVVVLYKQLVSHFGVAFSFVIQV